MGVQVVGFCSRCRDSGPVFTTNGPEALSVFWGGNERLDRVGVDEVAVELDLRLVVCQDRFRRKAHLL